MYKEFYFPIKGWFLSVVGRIIPHSPYPTQMFLNTLHGTRDFACAIKDRDLEMERCFLDQTGGLNLITWVLKSTETFLDESERERMAEGEIQSIWESQPTSAGFNHGVREPHAKECGWSLAENGLWLTSSKKAGSSVL